MKFYFNSSFLIITFAWSAGVPSSLMSQETTIVPLEEQIDEDHARLELARALSHGEKHLNEALTQYFILNDTHPDNTDLILEISGILLRKKEYERALTVLYPAIDQHPYDPELLLYASRAERELAHLKKSQNLIQKAIKLAKEPRLYLLDYAETLMSVGSFYQAEEIYRDAIKEGLYPESAPHPEKEETYIFDLKLKLAWNLVSAQRYEEAEGLYRSLLWGRPNHLKVIEGLATLKVLEKDFVAALKYMDQLLVLDPEKSAYLLSRANTLYQSQRYCEALQNFEKVSGSPNDHLQKLLGIGKTYRKMGDFEQGQAYFQSAYDNYPESIDAQYYVAEREMGREELIQTIIHRTTNPQDLEKWTNVFAENGIGGLLEFQEAALKIDPDFFPAQIGLADAYSAEYRYDLALTQYLSLLDSFSCASKLMMAIARVYSWSKEYECSFQWYDRLIEMNPQDPLPRREKARASYWGYYFDYSMSIYQSLFTPSLDSLFLQTLQEKSQFLCDPLLSEGICLVLYHTLKSGLDCVKVSEFNRSKAGQYDNIDPLSIFEPRELSPNLTLTLKRDRALVSDTLKKNSIYSGYEAFSRFFDERKEEWYPSERSQIEWILIQYLPDYRIQKSALLESEAKRFDWLNDYFHALPVYDALATFSPGNEEGLYDYAQDFCNLGLCDSSRQIYRHILNINANHSMVKMALERNLLKDHWLVRGNYSYWKERGIDQFAQSQIARHQFDEIAEWSPSCNFHLRFCQNEWIEYAFVKNKAYPAEGQTIEVDKQFNGFVKGSAGAAYKNYFHQFDSRFTCFGTLWFNCYDYFNIGLGIERKNEIYNYFSLKQGTQASVYWVSVTSNLNHYWAMGAIYQHLEYNDKNRMNHIGVLTSFTFSDDPNIFKVIFQGNYRNTAHLSVITIDPIKMQVTNDLYPYWTPQHYYSNSMTLEYRHNFAFFNYCEAPLHYLDIKVTGEIDTDRNPSFQLEFEWKRDFMRHWGFEVKGLIHQSELWNAEGAWMTLYYRF